MRCCSGGAGGGIVGIISVAGAFRDRLIPTLSHPVSLSLSTPAWGVGKTGFPRRTRSFYCVIIIAGPDEVASPRALDRRMCMRARLCLMMKSRVFSAPRKLAPKFGSFPRSADVQWSGLFAVCKQSRFRIIFRCRRPQTCSPEPRMLDRRLHRIRLRIGNCRLRIAD